MKRLRFLVVASMFATTMALGAGPSALATHCTPVGDVECAQGDYVNVTVVEGLGLVCGAAGEFAEACVHDLDDPIWTKTANNPPADGLYWPAIGPAGTGPFIFSAGGLTPPTGVCVSTLGGAGCVSNTHGDLFQGEAAGLAGDGAYCGSSHGTGIGTFSAGDGSASYEYEFSWRQSAATILPLEGSITEGPGAGAQLVGFTSSRGVTGTGNCGITQATTAFQVEGMTVTY